MSGSQFVASQTHEGVASLLRQLICIGEIPIGSRLPSQRELAATLGVSRQLIIVALGVLEEQGLIETRLGVSGGSFVSKPRLQQKGIRRWVRKYLSDLDEIFDFRIAVEQRASYLAATSRTNDDLKAMRHAIEALPEDGAPLDTFRMADGRFHTAIARSTRNARIEEASRKVRSDLFIPADTIEFEQEIELTRKQHTLIFKAIESRDAEGAAAQMVAHIEETERASTK